MSRITTLSFNCKTGWSEVYSQVLDLLIDFYSDNPPNKTLRQEDLVIAMRLGFDISTIPIELIEKNVSMNQIFQVAVFSDYYQVVKGLCSNKIDCGYPRVAVGSPLIVSIALELGDKVSFKYACGSKEAMRSQLSMNLDSFLKTVYASKNKKLVSFFLSKGALIEMGGKIHLSTQPITALFQGNNQEVISFLNFVLPLYEKRIKSNHVRSLFFSTCLDCYSNLSLNDLMDCYPVLDYLSQLPGSMDTIPWKSIIEFEEIREAYHYANHNSSDMTFVK